MGRTIRGTIGLAVLLTWVVATTVGRSEANVPPRGVTDTPLSVAQLVRKVLRDVPERGMSFALMMGVIEVESNFDPFALKTEWKKIQPGKRSNYAHRVNLATSHGLTQVMGSTAAGRGVHWAELYDEETSIQVGALELARCLRLEKFEPEWAATCYNAGWRKDRAKYPKGARAHAAKVMAAMQKYLRG